MVGLHQKKYANDMYPVCNDAEHGGLLVFIVRATVASWLVLCTLKARLATSNVDNCNKVGSQLPHRAHISRASCLKKLSREKVLEF